jgi:UDPglucose 6-dehydrogenase
MQPSYGFGGSCLPKELTTLAVAGQKLGMPMHVTAAASAANLAAQERFAERIAAALGGPGGHTVGLLGLAFKAGTDDTRDSPALRLAGWLLARGARVRAYDPAAAGAAVAAQLPGLEIVDSAEAAVLGADVAVIATEWPEFRELPWATWADAGGPRLIVDGRRLLDAAALRELGYRVIQLGDGRLVPSDPAALAAATTLASRER